MATTPRIADIGAVPDGLGEDLTRFLQQVQRLLRTGVQTGGISGSGSGSSGGGTTIIGGGTSGSGLPGMDDPTPPPTPSGVTVDAGLSYVFFETAAPVFTMGAGYDRTRVYIAQYPASAPTPPTFGDAVLAYEFVGQIGAMPAEPATRLCVWLKWRTKAGYDSTTPAGGINGFIVETGQDVELLLKALTGSITASELHAALGARIDLIDGPDTMAGSVAARLLAEATARSAAITTEQNARQTADTSLANSITTLTASVGANAAAISNEQTARVDADASLASSITTLASTVNGNTAAITAEQTARANADLSIANSISTLVSWIDGNSAVIQAEAETRASVDGHVASLYTVRTSLTSGGRTVVGGFGLSGTSSATAGATIDFGVRADRFWIGPPNDGSAPGVGDILPFIVQATPTTINGLAVPAGVYINDAFIRNGTITNAKIGNAAIDDAKIANLSAAKIIAGSLAVGQYIQSSNYIPGAQGWRINADGSAQFMAANIAGQLTAGQIDTRGLSIKDASGNVILAAGSALPTAYAAAGTLNSDVVDGSNVVYNGDLGQGPLSVFSNNVAAEFGINLNPGWILSPTGMVGTSVGWAHQVTSTGNNENYCEVSTEPFQVEPGTRMIASAYTGAYRCRVIIGAYFFNESGYVGYSFPWDAASTNNMELSGGSGLSDYKRIVNVMDIPSGAKYAKIILRKMETIEGGGDSWMFYTRIACKKTGSTASDPGPWAPSGLANPTNLSAVNPITPANISTYIAAASIGEAQIANLSVGDAKVGNFIKSFNFNGAIDSAGNVTNIGTTGWALGRAGVMVVDAAHIRGRLTASQINATTLTAITANLGDVTAGTLSNSTGSTFINMNATGSQVLLRSGAFDYGTGRYPVQITADGEALFTKQVASGTWSGSALYFQRTTVGSPPSITSGIVVIDTGYNYPYGQSINRDFIARVSTFTTYGGDTTAPGQYSHAVSIGLSARRGIPLFTTGAAQNQSSNIFGANNDRIYIFMEVNMIHDSVSTTVFARNVVSVSWNLLLGV